MTSHYDTLGVSENASPEEIKKAYRRLAKESHPDKNPDNPKSAETFKNISKAYEELGDVRKKQQYDTARRMSGGFSDMGGVFNSFRNSSSFSDAFNSMYGERTKGADIRASIQVSLMDVYYGTRKTIDMSLQGFGIVHINVPKGIQNGATLRVNGKGQRHPSNPELPPGDLLVQIHFLYSEDVIIQGDDIWIDHALTFYDLLLGSEIEIVNPFYSISVTVPPKSYQGKVLRIVNKGMPIYNTASYGSLMIKLHVNNVELNDEQTKLVREIKEIQDKK